MILRELGSNSSGVERVRSLPRLPNIDFAKFACPPEERILDLLTTNSLRILDYPDIEKSVGDMELLLSLLTSGVGNEPLGQKMIGMGFYYLLQELSHRIGLLTPESINQDHLAKIIPAGGDLSGLEKEMNELSQSGKRIGIYHGSFDPTHFGHMYDVRGMYDFVDYIIVAIEPLWLLRQRKDVSSDPRPRVPNRLWTMAQLAVIPGADRVIELPLLEGQDIDLVFPEIMRRFSATYLCTRDDNPLMDKFIKSTHDVGGRTIVSRTPSIPWSLIHPMSSTKVWRRMRHKGDDYVRKFLAHVEQREQQIIKEILR